MTYDPLFLVYGAVFVAILLLAEGLYYMFLATGGAQWTINRRLRMLESGASSQEVLQNLRRKRVAKSSAAPGQGPSLASILRPLEDLLTRAGATIPLGRFLALMFACWLLGVVGVNVLAKISLLSAAAVATACVVVLPILFLWRRARRRVRKFGEQLPEALDLVVRSLEAGHPINTAMAMVGKEMPDPIGSEFGVAVDEITYGLNLRQALDNMSERVGQEDMRYVCVTMKIQQETGGNLAEVLANVSTVIRDRQRMYRKIKALAAEGRISAYILTGLPIVVFVAVSVMNPDYYSAAQSDPLFPMMIGMGVGLLLLGIITMWKIVKIKV